MGKMKFIQGENKSVGIKIVNRKNEDFQIRNAKYELSIFGSNIAESQGDATINDKEISAIISPQNKGVYVLTFTYEVALEVLKANVQVEVR